MAINYQRIGKKIRELRIKRKLSQETLAELCDLSSSYISYIETGKKRLSFATLEKLSKYLKKPELLETHAEVKQDIE